MPLYEFACPDCDGAFSELRPIAECQLPANCPQCGKSCQRIISAPGVIWIGHAMQGTPGLRPGSMRTIASQMMLDGEREEVRKKKYSGYERYLERTERENDQKRFREQGAKHFLVR